MKVALVAESCLPQPTGVTNSTCPRLPSINPGHPAHAGGRAGVDERTWTSMCDQLLGYHDGAIAARTLPQLPHQRGYLDLAEAQAG